MQAYNTYYQRTGVVLGDNQTAPRIMINGANYTATGTNPISGGNMGGVTPPKAICRGAKGPSMTRDIETVAPNSNLHTLMDKLGVRMPPGRAEGSEDRYVYLDSNGNPQEIQVCFQWNPPSTASGSGNVMVITGLTPDLARALDQMIDGKPDAQEGIFRQEGVANGTAGSAGVEWNRDNTFAHGATAASAGNPDENQVAVVIAHYKMNQ